MRKLKYRQIQQLVQNLIASKLGNWDLNPCRLAPGYVFLTTMIFYKKREKWEKKP
jgi:hypothetical protein